MDGAWQYSSALTAYSESQFALHWMIKSPSQSLAFNALLKLKKKRESQIALFRVHHYQKVSKNSLYLLFCSFEKYLQVLSVDNLVKALLCFPQTIVKMKYTQLLFIISRHFSANKEATAEFCNELQHSAYYCYTKCSLKCVLWFWDMYLTRFKVWGQTTVFL